MRATCLILAALALTLAAVARAGHIDVDGSGGVGVVVVAADGQCSLREAMVLANGHPGNGDCVVQPGSNDLRIVLPQNATFTLTDGPYLDSGPNGPIGPSGLPIVTGSYRIAGYGATITRSMVAGTPQFRLLNVAPGADLTILDVTISHGHALDGSGTYGRDGGGIYNRGTLTLWDSVVEYNVAGKSGSSSVYSLRGGYGGGIFNAVNGKLFVRHSTIRNNAAGAGNAPNGAGGSGGGLASLGQVEIRNSVVGSNAVGIGVGSAPYPGLGGGMLVVGDALIVNSTIVDNNGRRAGGGIAATYGSVQLVNSTLYGNIAPGAPGSSALNAAQGASVSLSYVTVTGNVAGGLRADGASITLDHSVIDVINGTACSVEDGGSVASLGYNLSIDFSCNLTAMGDQPGVDPLLLSYLSDNGGPTPTIMPQPASPVIDAIRPDDCVLNLPAGFSASEDQRGLARPQGYGCDIGAVEVEVNARRCYVDVAASGANDGSGWADAFVDLQSALGDVSCSTIWVADGIYTPGTQPGDRFEILPGMHVYGGFAGTETSLQQRDPKANFTVLSGDIDGNDSSNAAGIDMSYSDIVGDNSYHVVYVDGTSLAGDVTADTVLDGFVITGGEADGTGGDTAGAGLYCDGSPGLCSPTLANLVFSGNYARTGGGLFNNGFLDEGHSSPTLVNVTFRGNWAHYGGAMYNMGSSDGTSSPSLTNVTFIGNEAGENGGALVNNGADNGTSSPVLHNVTFHGNATRWAMGKGGAMYNKGSSSGTSAPVMANVTFSSNQADFGGAIYNAAAYGTLQADMTNVIFWNNQAGDSGDQIYNNGPASLSIDYSIVAGGNAGIVNADGSPATAFSDGSGNLDADPLLALPADNGGMTPTMLPTSGSPVIDQGTCANAPPVDQRGISRPQGTRCDIGAVEVEKLRVDGLCHVNGNVVGGADDGSSWADAYADLQDALNDQSCTEVWVAQGVYRRPAASSYPHAFELHEGVAVYGGFAGTESQRDQRDPEGHPTILSGDLENDDLDSDNDGIADSWTDIRGSNAAHVVYIDATQGPITAATRLDGFIITAGYGGSYVDGGGLYCRTRNQPGIECSPALSNLVFVGNRGHHGGAVYLQGGRAGSQPSLDDIVFRNNKAVLGGGMYVKSISGPNSPLLVDVSFVGNQAFLGGGLYCEGYNPPSTCSPVLYNVTFVGNHADSKGGGMYNKADLGEVADPLLANVTFQNNSAGAGGGIYNVQYASPVLTNVILWGNQATGPDHEGPQMSSGYATHVTLNYSIVEGGAAGLHNDTGTPFVSGTGNRSGDPDLGAIGDHGGFTPTVLPGLTGSAIDSGNNALCPDFDQRGRSRPLDGDHDGTATCDIGAVERRSDVIFDDGFESQP